jgi:hypothetical protein
VPIPLCGDDKPPLIRRFVEAHQARSTSFPLPPRDEYGLQPAEYFVWEQRHKYLQPIDRCRETPHGTAPMPMDGERVVDDLIAGLRKIEQRT